jgi:hypothetical protein
MRNYLKEDLYKYGVRLFDDMRELKEVGDVKEYNSSVLRWKYFTDMLEYMNISKPFYSFMNRYVMGRI